MKTKCTGYLPIVDVCESFAADVDLEDLGLNTFWKKGPKSARQKNYPLQTFFFLHLPRVLEQAWLRVIGIVLIMLARWDVEGIQIGATVTISRAIQVLKERKNLVFDKIVDHVSKVASEFIRNTATLGGNFILAQRNQLPSDIATILLAVDSTAFPRPMGNAVAYLNSAFLVYILLDKVSGDFKFADLRLTFGAFGRQSGQEKLKICLLESLLTPILLNAIKLLKKVIIVKEGTAHRDYRLLEYGSWHSPIAEPTKKAGAELQAYASQKVIAVISVADIPKGGENVGAVNMHGMDPLFADSIALNVGQPLGLVIAESQNWLTWGPKQAVVDHSTENLETQFCLWKRLFKGPACLSPPYLCPEQIGDFTKGMAEVITRFSQLRIMLPSQYHFYMETQTVLAIPDEDNCLVVYSSTQFPEDTAILIAKCLGIPVLNVLVITRRVGGGFGGKATKAIL
ncbi:hypothetical protein HPP92_013489 [Vanilla planifolia]|uniref:Uncharacterized protein n=1 Tax=Vanilla planifolia TaxID=51239 RepID=A0A835QZ55_VANPL|nr:hypothetical protein HPP92_013489 [Vanilla planifolia]